MGFKRFYTFAPTIAGRPSSSFCLLRILVEDGVGQVHQGIQDLRNAVFIARR
jgi:hypothetical protein